MNNKKNTPDTYRQDVQNARAKKYRNMFITLLILFFFSLYHLMSGSDNVDFQWSSTQLTVKMPDDNTFVLNFSEVDSIDLTEFNHYGTCISGGQSRQHAYGVWTNDIFGEYFLCVSTIPSNCIILHTSNSTYIINYESDETTLQLYQSLLELISL